MSITGDVSGIDTNPVPKYYLGIISELHSHPNAGKFDAVAVLSGPEPQRTHFEQIVIKQLSALDGQYAVVRGRPDVDEPVKEEGNLVIYPFLSRAELSSLLNETEIIISRSGYTTLMDLANTRHKAILCPTPGQYEQIYLADRLDHLGQCVYVRQDHLDLEKALQDVRHKSAIGADTSNGEHDYVQRLMHLCKAHPVEAAKEMIS
jgi:UDP-N-acetylglucosamine transferase subunit ALG13